jgi:hypothetical protein
MTKRRGTQRERERWFLADLRRLEHLPRDQAPEREAFTRFEAVEARSGCSSSVGWLMRADGTI